MKGIIFSDFLEFAARELPGAELDGGPYGALDTYPDADLLDLVARAEAAAGLPPGETLRRFGAHLFGTFAALYPVFFAGIDSAFDLLSGIETYVHGEVRKLYPDAAFPRFDVEVPGPGRLAMTYRSERPLADLAEGLIRGCVAHFGDPIAVERRDLDGGGGRAARFTLQAAPAR